MDMNYGDDLYDSFVSYQGALIEQFDRMADEYNNFVTLDAREEPEVTQKRLRRAVTAYLESGTVSTERGIGRS
jgi:thymidylate kinase